MINKVYIIYHQVKPGTDCPDGIAAVWVAHREHPEAEIIGRCYNDDRPLPEFIAGDRIIIVDFSFPAAQIAAWICAGIEVMVIDHHKTAWADLSTLEDVIVKQYPDSDMIAYGSQGDWGMSRHITSPKEGKRLASHIAFDMRECGATLAWDIFYGGVHLTPAFLEFIRSRDLWIDCDLFKEPIPKTLIVHEAIASLRHEKAKDVNAPTTQIIFDLHTPEDIEHARIRLIFALFDELAALSRTQLLERLTPIGLPKLEAKRQQIEAIAQRATFTDLRVPRSIETLDGDDIGWSDTYEIPVVALESHEDRLTSDVCSKLYKTHPTAPFVACIASDGTWSLRSDKDGNNTDVGAIAKALGGGGHHNAAGFKPKICLNLEAQPSSEVQNPSERSQPEVDMAMTAYSYGGIVEGFAAQFLGLDRIAFRDRWIAWLRENPTVAEATGHLSTASEVQNPTPQKIGYVGLVKNKQTDVLVSVSAAATKRRAGELLEQWLNDHDRHGLDFTAFGVQAIASDYVDLEHHSPKN